MNPYEILGLTEEASNEEIKTTYRKLAKQYHPDSHPDEDAYEKMSQINKAYELIQALRRSGEEPEEGDFWEYDVRGHGNSMEEYTKPRRSLFQNQIFRSIVLIIVIASMLIGGVLVAFFQAVSF